MSAQILIFGGTTEGRLLAEALSRAGREALVCTVTAYGEKLLEGLPHITVRQGRLDAAEMRRLMAAGAYAAVLDATHPYASDVTKNIREAAAANGLRYLRVLRQPGDCGQGPDCEARAGLQNNEAEAVPRANAVETAPQAEEDLKCTQANRPDAQAKILGETSHIPVSATQPRVTVVPDTKAAAAYLAGTEGNILLTTGSKELGAFARLPGFAERVYARVLPDAESLARCAEAGLSGGRIIAMQGPFGHELNLSLLKHIAARYLVTKDGGSPGGLEDKISAAHAAGVEVLLVARPPEEGGVSLAEALAVLGIEFD